jgi:uncharacterized protein YggE
VPDQPPTPGDRTLTVHGTGRASVVADVAEVTLGVDLARATAREARDAAAEAMGAVVAAIRELGVDPADVRTTDLSLGPEIEYRPDGSSRRTGYRLTNRVVVRMRDPERVAEVVDAAVAAGATSLDGVAFRALATADARFAALQAAVADARAGAEALAAAAGATLGQVRSIREGLSASPLFAPRLATMEAKAADTPVLAGTSEVEASAEITWELGQAADRAV